MTASRRSRRASRVLVAAALAVLALGGCRTPIKAVSALSDPLEPMRVQTTRIPGPEDVAAARLAAGALATNPGEMERALEALKQAEAVQDSRPASDDSDLLPLAYDLVNATLDDPAHYRSASRELRRDWDADPALRTRLEEAVDDDPLDIADDRILDSRKTILARTFNAISEPLGKSLITGFVVAPFTIASTVVHWLAMLYSMEPISLQGRQALVQQQRFVDENPGTPEALEVVRDMEGARRMLDRTHRDRLVKASEQALDVGRIRLALAQAERALSFMPEDKSALQLRDEAMVEIARDRELQRASLDATQGRLPEFAGPVRAEALALAHALLLPGADITQASQALRDADSEGTLHDEAEYALSIAEFEKGWETSSWERVTRLAYSDPRETNMARHATGLLANPWQDPYGAFKRIKNEQQGKLISWKLLGPWSERPRYGALPPSIAYLIDAPAVAQTFATAPIRLVLSTVQGDRDFQKPSSVMAYRYLERHPSGEHEGELIRWLYDYEESQENWNRALRLSDYIDGFDPEERRELVEEAAAQQLETASKAKRRDLRGSVLRNIAREFPDSDAGHFAGQEVRLQLENASSQKIRMTREFLRENPRIVGPEGLGLRPELRDDDPTNGELHPHGITFLGAREIELAFLAEGGDDEDPPETRRRTISAERLARVVALVEETVLHNSQIDPDDRIGADARRDYYFERARLGLTDEPDTRATAESTYVYLGMRERYGMVRAREGILPFDLVVQGNFSDFSFGAFPRWREPKETPDAFLYR